MARLVMKFGGTSVADLKRIQEVAGRVKDSFGQGNEILVVVSAMAGTTDQLINWAVEAAQDPDPHEYDSILSAGEQISAGLLALAIQQLGVSARSWLGWQIPIFTDAIHGNAKIEHISPREIQACFSRGQVPVIAGFQGKDLNDRISTLGRGGSDTSAVALAAAVDADRCDIYTDVNGVFTADPRVVAKATKLDKITYEEMLEMASQGARVLQTRSVSMAMNHQVRVQVLSSFSSSPGTLVVDEDEILEKQVVSGIAYSRDESKVTLVRVNNRPGVAGAIFGTLADSNINVDIIVQSVSEDGQFTDITFTVKEADFERTLELMKSEKHIIGFDKVVSDTDVSKISVIGVGMRSHAGVASQMFSTLGEKGINIHAISTSEIKVSVLISAEYTELALRSLHSAYGLDSE